MTRTLDATVGDLESFVDAFEGARAGYDNASIEEFFPAREHMQYDEIVAELLRIDMELGWGRGEPVALEAYRERFAEVLAEPHRFEGLAFEDYRLRCQAGQPVTPVEYRRRYGVDTADWPPPESSEIAPHGKSKAQGGNGVPAAGAFPAIGQPFLDFLLVEELGRGAFGRVYLAHQQGLANRPVALKVTRGSSVEPGRLAQLQHTNIVPINSVHQAHGFEAMCMPYLGRYVLSDIIGQMRRDGLPKSGQELLTTFVARQRSTIAGSEEANGSKDRPQAIAARACSLAPSIRERFERSSYVDAVVWITAQICAGVAHAHERGILHRDLKPANVLMADDGRPMVLDFNLSDRLHSQARWATTVGGTLPYMAPEQLKALETGVGVDARSDIYAIGVLLYELLTGRSPFECATDNAPQSIAEHIAARQVGAPSVRGGSPQVPRSIAAVVGRCLAPGPDQRYQTVDQLHADLERHLENLPLQHAADRSPSERAAKWARRHPRLSSATSIGLVSLLLIAAILGAWRLREQRLARLEAQQTFADFSSELAEARIPLSISGVDDETIAESIASAREQLARYGAAQGDDWRDRPAYRLLPRESQRQLDRQVAKTVHLLKLAESRRAGSPNDQATPAFTDDEMQAITLLRSGRYGDAIPLLTKWRDESPNDLSAWMLLGNAYAGMGIAGEAEECFTTCTRIRPGYPFSYFQRGLARFEQRKYQAAADDFGSYLRRAGPSAAALINRALARHKVGDREGALKDLNAALAAGGKQTRIYFIRAEIRRALGDLNGAEADRELGMSLTPTDATSFLARGMAHLADEPTLALADFRQASLMDPGSRTAKQNLVHLLADRLNKPAEALTILDSLLAANPQDARALASRAVLNARQGDRIAAQNDALRALSIDDDPTVILQAACAFAASPRKYPPDETTAFRLLARALGAKPAMAETAAADPDLEALRSSPNFDRILEAADIMRRGGEGPEAAASKD